MSQSRVVFQKYTWDQALNEAKKQDKYLFVDVVLSIKSQEKKNQEDKLIDQALAVDKDKYLFVS